MSAPVFALELVTSARRARYFLWRVLYAVLLLAVLVIVYLISFGLEGITIQAAAEFAQNYLQSFALLQLGAVLLLGPALAAGAIARERETRTIEYLFTTHLSSAEIVLQKMAAAIAQLTVAVLAGVPVLSIAMLLGGITPEEVLAVTVVTISTILVVTSTSLAASTVSRRSREAVAAAYGLLFLALVAPSIFSGLARGTVLASAAAGLNAALDAANPLSVMGMVLQRIDPSATSAGAASVERWKAIQMLAVIHLSLSVASVGFSTWALRRISLTGAALAGGVSSRRRTLRPPLRDRPLVWREMFANRSYSRLARVGRGLLAVMVVLAMLGTLWQFVDCWTSNRRSQFPGFAMWLATILESLGLLLAAAWASNSVAAERERETWTTLVSTPLEAREIVFGKLAGSLYAARVTLVPLAFVWFLAAVAEPRFIPAIFFTLVGLLAAAAAGSMLGIFFSFWCANATRALGATLATVLGATVLGSCCVFPLGILNPLYLLLMPGFVTFIWIEAGGQLPSEAAWPLLMAGVIYGGIWLLGLAVHVGGACLLWAICIGSFDRFAGRIDTRVVPGTLSITTTRSGIPH